MKIFFVIVAFVATSLFSNHVSGQPSTQETAQGKDSRSSDLKPASKNLYMDVHHLGAGNVKYKAVAAAHAKDLAVQGKYGATFIKYWVDESRGNVYCLVSATDSSSVRKTHAEAHGLLPDQVYLVTDGPQASLNKSKNFFLDVHNLGAGSVTAKDVAGAHQKDLEVEKKYGVNFINYWLNEKEGIVMCLSQAKDSAAIIKTHKEAHGLIPAYIEKVKQGE